MCKHSQLFIILTHFLYEYSNTFHTGVCEHKRRRAECKECKGGSVCIHNRIRRRCGDCGGKAKCEHKRLKWQCKDCHGSSICHHKKRKHSCKLCKNEQMRLNAAAVLLELPGLEKSNTGIDLIATLSSYSLSHICDILLISDISLCSINDTRFKTQTERL